MKHARSTKLPGQPFPRVGPASKRGEGVWPLLAVLGVGVAVGVSMTLVPLPKASHDFRKGSTAAEAAAGFDLVQWPELIPKGWDPTQQFQQMQEAQRSLPDNDPRAAKALVRMREVLDAAPANAALDGRAVQIPGYVVPLEGLRHGATEFLLVPYFGACIHTPPPPANQIIHVSVASPLKGLRSMDAVWVRGTLRVMRRDSLVATSGYQLAALAVDRYEPPQGH